MTVLGAKGSRPGFSATTANFQAAYPFLADGGLGAPGVYIGADAYGGAWAFDPWELYQRELHGRKLMRSPNIIVLGSISNGKSTFIKTYLFRQHVFGRQAWVVDVKGEYDALGHALGHPPIRLSPGGDVRLNPISRRGGRERQLSLLRTVAKAALRRDLVPEEDAGLRVALDLVNGEASGEPTLPMIVDALLHPREVMVEGVSGSTQEHFATANRETALALQRLCEGDLRGMFDGPTTEGIDLDASIVIFDLSAMQDSEALGILMTCVAAWQQAVLLERARAAEAAGRAMRKTFVVVEEVWQVASNVAVAEWLQENFKLCRKHGIANILSIHKLTDFGAAGGEGSRVAQIAKNLIADAGAFFIFRQSPDQREVLRDWLGRTDTEVQLTMGSNVGEVLAVVGPHSALVQQQLSEVEVPISYTDEQMGVLPVGGAAP